MAILKCVAPGNVFMINPWMPFQAMCMPMHSRRNAERRITTDGAGRAELAQDRLGVAIAKIDGGGHDQYAERAARARP